MLWCARCGVPLDEGPILCDQCVPRENLSQSANVEMTSAPRVVIDSEGNIIENIPSHSQTTMKAFDMSAGSKSRAPLRADRKVRWNRDRKQYELCILLSIAGKTCIAKLGSTLPSGKLLGDRSRGHLAINPFTDLAPSVVSTTT
jgi:hypothetical protein